MDTTAKKMTFEELTIMDIRISDEMLIAHINDGRMVSIPINWFPRLSNANADQLQNFEISPGGYGVHWPDLDEDISIKSFIKP